MRVRSSSPARTEVTDDEEEEMVAVLAPPPPLMVSLAANLFSSLIKMISLGGGREGSSSSCPLMTDRLMGGDCDGDYGDNDNDIYIHWKEQFVRSGPVYS
ncbi:hypothetical protein ABZP36_032855 [Zizania latifolia]